MRNNLVFSVLRLFIMALIGMPMLLSAQEKTIQIVDEQTEQALADVHYQYNNEKGFSDSLGTIILNFAEHEVLHLSHIRLGKLSLSPEAVIESINSQVLRIKGIDKQLMPVTIVQVRSGAGENSNLEISMEKKLAHDAGSLMENVAGISAIRKSGAYGFDPVLRGFKYEQINLVLDGGQTASAACPNRMDPAASQIPINMIAEAEVLKGPHSLRYGNAFGGTINFKSSPSEFKDKTTPLGRVGTSYESNGNIFRTEGVAGFSGRKLDFRMFGSYSSGEDYTDGDGIDIPANFNRLNWGGKLGFKLTENQEIGFLLSNNVAKDVDFPALPMDLREDNTWLINANHSAQFYNKKLSTWKTSVYGTVVDHLMDNYDKMMNPRKVDAFTEAETKNYGGRTELRFDFEKSYFYGGMDYRFESADGFRERTMLMGPMAGKVLVDNVWQDAQIQRTGFFGEWHVNNPGFHFVVSGRLDFNSSKLNDPDDRFIALYDDLESNIVHPSVSAGGTRMFNEKLSFGLWMGMATRSPGITERYINQFPVGLDPYEMLGNPELDPEINNQLDLVFKYQSQHTRLSLNAFSSILRDYISSEIKENLPTAMPSSPGVRQYVNIKEAFMAGFEASWSQQITGFMSHDLSLVYTYGENQVLDEPLPEIPPLEFRYRLMGNLAKNKLHPEILWRSVAKQSRVAASYGENESPGFNVLDAKINWNINSVLTASGGVLNLLDEAYYEHLARSVRSAEARPIYSPGRSFYVTLTVNFL